MTIQSTQEAAFSQEDIAVLQTMADQVANAIANARLYDQAQRELAERMRVEQTLRQRNRNLILLNQVGQELATTLDLRQVLERLLQAVTEIVGAEGASVWLEDEERGAGLVCRASFHQGLRRSLVNLRLRPGQGIAGWVAQTGKGIVVPRVSEDPRFFSGIDKQTDSRTESLLAVPLGVRGKVIGVLEAVNKLRGEFSMDDLVLVETLAASAAIAIDNARLIEMMRQYAAELEARNVDLDAFAHTAAHDLKGPLGYLVGFAHVLEEDHAALSDQELRHYLQILARSGRKMGNIIDELLLLASVRKVEEIELEPLDMASIVHEAQGRLAYLIAEHQAEIVVPDTWPVVLGYSAWVEEVWINYLSNAIQYGGQPPLVELGATQQADGTIRFWVRDNGPGLTPQEQKRLFTPFTRLDQVRTKGHGLGLSIVRRIVEKLEGQVGVESRAGQGSTFWFTLSWQ
jgi:signal transduction histidine kinase